MTGMTNKNLDGILLKITFVFEIAVTILIATGFAPREVADLSTAVLLIYIIGANLEDSLIIAIISIPFFIALPITSSFDSMANWRIIFLALFLKFTFEKVNIQYLISNMKILDIRYSILDIKNAQQLLLSKNNRLLLWSSIFIITAILSLVGSGSISAGIKKILFLANIFLLFFIVKNLSQNKETFLKILKASVLAGTLSLAIGYLQVLSILRFSLAHFWQFWDNNAIAALYGNKLSDLLSYSNTWFSYYSGDIPPTLRMFSVFPDSHSFALFNVILIPFILTLTLYYKNKSNNRMLIAYCLLLIACLLAIILSASRGAWVSGAAPLLIILILKGRYMFNEAIKFKNGLIRNSKFEIKNDRRLSGIPLWRDNTKFKNFINGLFAGKFRIIALTAVLFFALFPISSVILEQTQKAEWRRLNTQGDFESFAVYKRLKSIMDLDEISNKGRIEIWKNTLVSIKKHPLLGVGIGNFPTIIGKNISAAKKGASAHNLFLDIMAEMGILGLIAFLAIFYEILKTARNVFLNSKDDIYKFFALAAGVYLFWILGYALFDVVLFNDKVLMIFMLETGLLYGIKNIKTA